MKRAERLPRSRLRLLVTCNLCTLSLLQSCAETLSQPRKKMRETTEHRNAHQKEIAQLQTVRLLPRPVWETAGKNSPLDHFRPRRLTNCWRNGQFTTDMHRITHIHCPKQSYARIRCDRFAEDEVLCPCCNVVPRSGGIESIVPKPSGETLPLRDAPTAQHCS